MSLSVDQQPQAVEPQEPQESDLAESSPSPQNLQPEQDSTPQDQSASSDSPEPEAQSTEPEAQAAEPEAQTAEPTPTPAWPDPSGWENFSDLDIESLPEASRPHFVRAKELYAAKEQELETQKARIEKAVQDMEESRSTFHRLIDQMDSTGDTKAVATELDRYRGGFNSLASENIALAQRMFKVEHPNFERYPQDVRNAWANEMSDETFYSRYSGATIYDKMKEAWNFALFRSGAKPSAPKPPQASVPHTMTQAKGSTAQALVADGRGASSMPTPDAEDMSFDDILSMHDHLLKS